MVAAVSTTTTATLNPKRRPLFPSEAENGQPRRPKSREVSSRYLSSSNSSKQRQTPNVTRTERSQGMPAQNSAKVSRSRSVGRGRPGTSEMSAATKLLLTSTRSSSISFQGESFSLSASKAKPAKKIANRIDTSERRRSETETESVKQMDNAKRIDQQRWPGRTKPANSSLNKRAVAQMETPVKDRMDNAKPIDKLRLLGRSKSINSSLLTRSLDCGKDRAMLVSGGTVRLSQKSVTDEINQFSIETKVKPEVYTVEPLRIDVPVANLNSSYGSTISAEAVACDSESVSSGSGSSGQEYGPVSQLRGRPSIVGSVPVLQQDNGRIRRGAEPHSPVSRKNGYTTLVPSKQIDNKKSLNESRVSSLRDIPAFRGFSSYLRGRFTSGSPSKTSTPSTSYPMRGSASPTRARVGAVITMTNNVGDTPSTLSFATDVRGKAGENWFADVHELRLLYNRHLQWRFVNAKTEGAHFKLTETAERNLYNAQLATSKLLHSVKSKQTELLLLKQNLKLYRILKGQVPCFENWGLIDKEYCSSLAAAICALEASTIRLPVVNGARADIQKLKSAICSAVDVMQAMASSIRLLQSKVEQMRSLLIELSSTVSSEHSSLDHCKDLLSTVTDMQVKHCSLRTHLLQLKDTPSCSTQL